MINLRPVLQRIEKACEASGRNAESVGLLAVSKTFDAGAIRQAAALGQCRFGENYLQEARVKQTELADLPLEWHFIGPLQSNKTREIAEHFSWVHSVDRERIARRLHEARPAHLPPLNVCVQVNISGEASKSGCNPEQAQALCEFVCSQPGLKLRGLMAIPAATTDVARARASYERLAGLFNELKSQGMPLDTLSAGMSGDLELAIAHGATLVRVGSAIFGNRKTGTAHQ